MVVLATALILVLLAVSATLPTSNGFTTVASSSTRMNNLPSTTLHATDPAPPSMVDEECTVDEDIARSSSSTAHPVYPTFPEKERLLYEALGKFVDGDLDNYSFEPTSGGVNNVVFYVTKKGNDDGASVTLGVLRIYNNSNDTPRVEFEHAILGKLGEQRDMLSFGIPETFPSIITGNRYEKLSDGSSSCMFKLMIGGLPKLTKVREIGLCAGELSTAMAKIDRTALPEVCPNFPYWDIYKVHKSVSRDKFYEELRSDQFDEWRTSANEVEKDLIEVEERIASYHDKLPWSIIHGDLHYDNILVDDDGVTGLLDFEFSSYDWRAMELAICLSKYCSEDDPYPYFEQFVDGFAVTGELTAMEIESICTLIRLRILSNVVYFVGRALAGEDTLSTLTCRIDNYCQRLRWVKTNEEKVVALIKEKFRLNKKL
jgi:homoserine kinase type II